MLLSHSPATLKEVYKGETAMNTTFKLMLTTVTVASLSLLATPSAVV